MLAWAAPLGVAALRCLWVGWCTTPPLPPLRVGGLSLPMVLRFSFWVRGSLPSPWFATGCGLRWCAADVWTCAAGLRRSATREVATLGTAPVDDLSTNSPFDFVRDAVGPRDSVGGATVARSHVVAVTATAGASISSLGSTMNNTTECVPLRRWSSRVPTTLPMTGVVMGGPVRGVGVPGVDGSVANDLH